MALVQIMVNRGTWLRILLNIKETNKQAEGYRCVCWKVLMPHTFCFFKEQKTCTMFLSSYRNTSENEEMNEKCCGNTSRSQVFPQLFKFSQTFTSVSITRQRQREHVLFLLKQHNKKGKQLANFAYQNVNSLHLHHHYRNTTFNQSVRMFSKDCFLKAHRI